ncbi:MAG: RodZ domain-containing protein [Pseudomonadota bacterium]
MELRGFDSYSVSLGDELRGERACRGWSLRDASRQLCIRPELIEAIENADVGRFPNRSVVPGYVRSYARALGLDADEIYQRFCHESGFESSLVTFGMTASEAGSANRSGGAAISGAVGADFTLSRFAVRPAPRRVGAAVSLGGLVSGLALMLLVGGLGYGGYALLQDIQRVGFAPLPEAPVVVADAPEIATPAYETPAYATATVARPAASAYGTGGVLLGYAAAETVPATRVNGRDGPISAINPDAVGLVQPLSVAAPYEPTPAEEAASAEASASPILGRKFMAPKALAALNAREKAAEPVSPAALALGAVNEPSNRVTVLASDRAWVRVRDGEGAVLFEGIMSPGDRFELPERVEAATLRAGNAGGVFIGLGGERFGPLGRSGAVVKRVSLRAEDVREGYEFAGSVAEIDEINSAAAE